MLELNKGMQTRPTADSSAVCVCVSRESSTEHRVNTSCEETMCAYILEERSVRCAFPGVGDTVFTKSRGNMTLQLL